MTEVRGCEWALRSPLGILSGAHDAFSSSHDSLSRFEFTPTSSECTNSLTKPDVTTYSITLPSRPARSYIAFKASQPGVFCVRHQHHTSSSGVMHTSFPCFDLVSTFSCFKALHSNVRSCDTKFRWAAPPASQRSRACFPNFSAGSGSTRASTPTRRWRTVPRSRPPSSRGTRPR